MKSRLTVTVMLVLGIMLSTTGASLAVSGIASSGSASSAQYGKKQATGGGGGTLGVQATGDQSTSPSNQVVAANDSGGLPFTGYAGLTVLLIGVGTLGAGLVIRRRSRTE